MTRHELFRSIIFTAVVPLLVAGNGIRGMYVLINSEHISESYTHIQWRVGIDCTHVTYICSYGDDCV